MNVVYLLILSVTQIHVCTSTPVNESSSERVCWDLEESWEQAEGGTCTKSADCVTGYCVTGNRCRCLLGNGHRLNPETQVCDLPVEFCNCGGQGVCDGGDCTNRHPFSDPGYDCRCWPGRKHVAHHICRDINECEETPDICGDPDFHTCVNHDEHKTGVNFYSCRCNPVGFHSWAGVGHPCTNINECEESPDEVNCASDSTCVDTYGSFTCECNEGFVGDGFTQCYPNLCLLGDPCPGNLTQCDPTETGEVNCSCVEGTVGNGFNCLDTNECEEIEGICGGNSTCVNEVPGYSCQCDDPDLTYNYRTDTCDISSQIRIGAMILIPILLMSTLE